MRQLFDLAGGAILHLAPDAQAAFIKWEHEIESMLGDGGRMELLRDWGGKLAGATLRLAAVLHSIEHEWDRPIGPRSIAAAVELANYAIPHAAMVLNLMGGSADLCQADVRYLLRWIERHSLSEFKKTEAQHHGKNRFPKVADIEPALKELIDRNYIRMRPSLGTGPGRKRSPVYEVNPAVLARLRGRISRNGLPVF